MKRTAVLIDGGFFFQRVMFFGRKYFSKELLLSADQISQIIKKLVKLHIMKMPSLPLLVIWSLILD